jgi:hypothetical protein
MTEEVAERILSSQQQAIALLQQLQGAGGSDASSKVLEQLRRDSLVSECSILSDGTIWARYTSGLEAEILGASDGGDLMPADFGTANLSGPRKTMASLAIDQLGRSKTAATETALFLLPFYAEEDTAAGYVQQLLESAGFTIHGPLAGAMVTVELMRAMSAHKVVYVTTHGSPKSLFTGQTVTTAHDLTMMWNRYRNRIGIGFPHGSLVPYYTIGAAFIRDYRYAKSLVFANACSTLKDGDSSELACAFIDSGASVYFGWDDLAYVEEWCTGQATRGIFENLVVPGATVSTAYRTANRTPYGLDTQQRYSVDTLYPVEIYKDSNGNAERRICYADLDRCVGDPGDVTLVHDVDFRYVGEGGFVLCPVSAPDGPGDGAPEIYVGNHCESTVVRAKTDGSDVEDLGGLSGLLHGTTAGGIAIDQVHGRMYVITGYGPHATTGVWPIVRANLDGTGAESLSNLGETLTPSGIALDVEHGKMYIADGSASSIIWADLDGTNMEDLGTLDGTLSRPWMIAVDVEHGKMYVLNVALDDRVTVVRANLDGTAAENLGDIGGTQSGRPIEIALDVEHDSMYVIHSGGRIVRADLDGTGIEDLGTIDPTYEQVGSFCCFDYALDLEGRKIYATTLGDRIIRADLDGTNVETVLDLVAALGPPTLAVYAPMAIALWFPPADD